MTAAKTVRSTVRETISEAGNSGDNRATTTNTKGIITRGMIKERIIRSRLTSKRSTPLGINKKISKQPSRLHFTSSFENIAPPLSYKENKPHHHCGILELFLTNKNCTFVRPPCLYRKNALRISL